MRHSQFVQVTVAPAVCALLVFAAVALPGPGLSGGRFAAAFAAYVVTVVGLSLWARRAVARRLGLTR